MRARAAISASTGRVHFFIDREEALGVLAVDEVEAVPAGLPAFHQRLDMKNNERNEDDWDTSEEPRGLGRMEAGGDVLAALVIGAMLAGML